MRKQIVKIGKSTIREKSYPQAIIVFNNRSVSKRKIYTNKKRKLTYVIWNSRFFLLLSHDEEENKYKYLEVSRDYIEGKKIKDELELVEIEEETPEEVKTEEETLGYKKHVSHPKEQQIMDCIECNIPVYSCGPWLVKVWGRAV